ncbi:MAG: preprotein translocase subunit YajC, partial [Oscillospiraceae bacterium]|nr:preprotein translocase subunit YajC [Oscillospiraceae bacterium]
MNTALLTFLLRAENAAANPANPEVQGQVSLVSSLIIMAVMFVMMYFLMIRPQKKKEKEQQAMKD